MGQIAVWHRLSVHYSSGQPRWNARAERHARRNKIAAIEHGKNGTDV